MLFLLNTSAAAISGIFAPSWLQWYMLKSMGSQIFPRLALWQTHPFRIPTLMRLWCQLVLIRKSTSFGEKQCPEPCTSEVGSYKVSKILLNASDKRKSVLLH
jgi:uncharacterized protein YqcC (DUF446 family)